MTGATLLAYIKRTFLRTDKDDELYEAITDTIVAIKMGHPFEDFKTEAYVQIAALGDYKIPLDDGTNDDVQHIIGHIRFHDGDDSYPLNKMSKEDFDVKYPDPNYASVDTGKPTDYCIFGNELLLGMVPDSVDYTYEMSYSTASDDYAVVAATDPVPFSARYREMLKHGTLSRIYSDLEMDNKVAKHESLYRRCYETFKDKEDQNTKTTQHTEYQDI